MMTLGTATLTKVSRAGTSSHRFTWKFNDFKILITILPRGLSRVATSAVPEGIVKLGKETDSMTEKRSAWEIGFFKKSIQVPFSGVYSLNTFLFCRQKKIFFSPHFLFHFSHVWRNITVLCFRRPC